MASAVPSDVTERLFGPLRKWQLRVLKSGSDGSCFFHTLAQILNHDDAFVQRNESLKLASGLDLRKRLHDHLDQTSDADWTAFWDSQGIPASAAPTRVVMKERLSQPAVWADQWAIVWAMKSLKTNPVFIDMSFGGSPYCGISDDPRRRTPSSLRGGSAPSLPSGNWRSCLIGWYDRAHFQPLVLCREGGIGGGSGKTRFAGGVHEVDGHTYIVQFSGALEDRLMKV